MTADFGQLPWPPGVEFVDSLLARKEDALLDFKREWYEDSGNGKAELVKDILAMSNQVNQGQAGLIAIGFEETPKGTKIVPVVSHPSADSVSQILTHYANPVPDVRVQHLQHRKGKVSLVGIFWNQYQPHYALRDVPPILNKTYVYCRRGATVGTLTPQEHEILIRGKMERVGTPMVDEPLQVGFIEIGALNTDTLLEARIENVTDEPIVNIRTMFDVAIHADPRLCVRVRKHQGMRLQPRESVELRLHPSELTFYKEDKFLGPLHQLPTHYKWFDVVLRVQFRGSTGFMHELSANIALADW